ncbi:MAG: hypothetical protein Q9182_000284 [Xanthomendoza sp. 2 TL-2023]
MAGYRMLSLMIAMVHLYLAFAAPPPETIALVQAIEQPAPLPGTGLNMSEVIKFRVPNTETIITFKDFGPARLYQTDLSLCVLEGMNDLFTFALKKKGDGLITGDRFETKYGQTGVLIKSYSPPAFSLTTAVAFDALRAISLFSSLYGYYEVEFEVYHRKLGHVGVGWVKFLRR